MSALIIFGIMFFTYIFTFRDKFNGEDLTKVTIATVIISIIGLVLCLI